MLAASLVLVLPPASVPHARLPSGAAWHNISLGGHGSGSPCGGHAGATCIFDARRCVSRGGLQCGILEHEAEAKCGAWEQCAGVVCRADYGGYCLARAKMTAAASSNMWGYDKGSPSPVPSPNPSPSPRPSPNPSWPPPPPPTLEHYHTQPDC
jgi:hypothetical protein